MTIGGDTRASERRAEGRAPGGRRRAVALALAAAVLASLALAAAAGPASAASGLPAVNVTYEVSFFFGETGYVEEGSFVATGASGGSDGALALTFASLSGGRTNTFEECEGKVEHTSWAIAPALNPRPGDWFLEETSQYPFAGWKYEISGYPATLPLLLTEERGACATIQREVEEPVLQLLRYGCPPANSAECEAMESKLEFKPGEATSRTRSVAFEVNGHIQRMTIKVTVTSTASGNTTEQPQTPRRKAKRPATRRERTVSERRRRALKQQAKRDFKPALEAEWQAHGLASVIGLGAGNGLLSIAEEIGKTAATLDGNDAGERVLSDWRIYKDPPARGYRRLAAPAHTSAPVLPSCGALAASGPCTQLRSAAGEMVAQAARASALDAAMLTTIDRDTAAIRARDYAAAKAQASHFAALHAQFAAALAAQGRAGATLARLLREAGVKGRLTKRRSAAAIGWARRRLAKGGVPARAAASLAPGALSARAVDALAALAHPAG